DDGTRGDKAKELALAAEFNQHVESATQDEFTVKVYRDTAVVWFTLHVVGTKQGQRAELTLRYTDVWVIRDGGWVCVSTQSTRVNPQQALRQIVLTSERAWDPSVHRWRHPERLMHAGEVSAFSRTHSLAA